MDIKVVSGDITEQSVGAIIVNLFEGVTSPGGATGAVDRSLEGAISGLISDGEIKGKRGELILVHTLGKIAPARVLVAGLGKASEFTVDGVRSVTAESCRRLRRAGVETVATIAHGAGIGGMDAGESAKAVAEGAILGLYRFDRHKGKNSDRRDINTLAIVESDAGKVAAMEKAVAQGTVIADAVSFCRDMANEPANHMTPTRMAEMALEAATASGLAIEVFERPKMEELGMGALLGVAQGSDEPPKFIVMRYRGDPENEGNILGLLGKGITFDSGGLDIKTAGGMRTMKGDMSGGASVISAMRAIGKLKPRINVVGIVPAAENMSGGRAQRPGDVVRALNGKTIEIDNTDAEGRLVLADAAAYAASIGVKRMVDVATLTGAVVTALGNICTGAFGSDQAFTEKVVAAGNRVGERVWELPTYAEYKEQYRSDVADIKNTGGRPAGAITGAMIIGEFVGDASWVHLDIAGTAGADKTRGYNPKGATGVPVRTLVALAQELARS